jgi:hypothetical protein
MKSYFGPLGMTINTDKNLCFEIDILQIYSTTEEYFQLDWKIAKNFLWNKIQVQLVICTIQPVNSLS